MHHSFFAATLLLFSAGSAFASNRYVSTVGTDACNTCLSVATPCLTVQHTIDQSSSGDIVTVAAGTYTLSGINSFLTVNKTLTFHGAQWGVDARTRSGPESILSNEQGINVTVSQVVFDGFTIRDSSNPAYTGYGIWLNPNTDGAQILNNIFTHNIAGLGLSNLGSTQVLIQHNVFDSNNVAGPASGTGIYTDEYVGGTVSNVLINENKFTGNANAGIGFSSVDITRQDSNITVSNNSFDNNGRGMYFYNTSTLNITGNTVTNLSNPTDGGSSTALGLWGNDNGVLVEQNNFESGPKYGIYLIAGITPDNTNVNIHLNNIFDYAVAGMYVATAPDSPVAFATCNWWRSVDGPSSTVNPDGTGDAVIGDVQLANFSPWLIGSAPDAPCGCGPSFTRVSSMVSGLSGKP